MQIWNPSASFTRPNTTPTYAAGQMVANSATPASVLPMVFPLGNTFPQGMLRLTRARLFKSSITVQNATFRAMIYGAAPVAQTGSGDGSVYLTNGAANWLGNIDFSSMITPAGTTGAFSDGAAGTGSFPAGSEAFLRLGSGATLYALLYALGAYVGVANEVFTLTLEELDNY